MYPRRQRPIRSPLESCVQIFEPVFEMRIAPLCSSASQLIWRSLTSRTRTSSATAPRLPDANQDSLLPLVRRGISRFPRNELVHMPGSSTTPGRPGTRVAVPVRIAFRLRNGVDAQGMNLYEAQWLAYALPYRRFAAVLTDCDARLGADMDRYSFIVSDLHRLLVAGLPAHCERFCTSSGHRQVVSGGL